MQFILDTFIYYDDEKWISKYTAAESANSGCDHVYAGVDINQLHKQSCNRICPQIGQFVSVDAHILLAVSVVII